MFEHTSPHGAAVAAPASDHLDRSRGLRSAQSGAMFVFAMAVIVVISMRTDGRIGLYGLVAVTYLAAKLLLAWRYRPAHGEGRSVQTVAAIVPFYNEDPAALRACLVSLLHQSRPVDSIFVVDDGSTSDDAFLMACDLLEGRGGAIVHRLPENQGKRHAQGWAMHHVVEDVVLTVDSDTVLDQHAVLEGLRAFDEPEVQGVTGNVQALNGDVNLVTRLSAVRYANAFLWDRAAYSAMGTVLCACGSLSFWRREVISENLDDYLNQSFLGIPVMYGDDRRLTNYALGRGQVLFQDTSIAYTAVPERLSHLVRQQLRWNKSFFRESLWVLRRFRPGNRVWNLSLSELGLWACFSVTLMAAVVLRPVLTGELVLAHYLIFPALMAYARSVRFIGSQPMPGHRQVAVFAMAPVYAVLHLLVLTPLRLWALFTLRQRGWGTRGAVEVTYGTADGAANDGASPDHDPGATVVAAPTQQVESDAQVALAPDARDDRQEAA